MALIQCHECSGQVSDHARKWFFILFLFVAIGAFAQTPAPTWLGQIKLTGISGFPDHPLADINGKTLAAGEECDLKLKGRTVHLQCLEIHEQSVSVQVQGLPAPCELTFSGIILPVETSPATAPSPAPAPVMSMQMFVPTQPARPLSGDKSFSFGLGWVLAGMVIALMVGISMGSVATQWQHRKNIGEAMLANTIGNHFDRPHLLVNNVTLPTAEGTTQIDHVLVADTGIFVIEAKHYSGWVFGNASDSQWTQVIYHRKSRFQNPLRQNYGHVKTLQSLFDLPETHFHSVVVFTSDAKFKSDLGPNVIQLSGLISFLAAERPVVFDERKMAYIVGRIEMKRERRSLETDEYHINHVRDRLAGKFKSQVTR